MSDDRLPEHAGRPSQQGSARGPALAGDPAVAVRGLTKRYGEVLAVDDLSFSLFPGEVDRQYGAAEVPEVLDA